ncbi:MAG TPA: ATP12 family protein [Methylocella sp.]|nr:ATP12 family protein [Methylocella sp.]
MVNGKPDAGDGASHRQTPPDPFLLARRDLSNALPRRFYKEAEAREREGQFVLLLDGRLAKTPGGKPLALPSRAAAGALAAEWQAVDELIDPARMPLTRIVHSATDSVAHNLEATIAEIAKYAGSDLVCYRAGEPEALVLAQSRAWDPVLAFVGQKLGAHFLCAEGVMFIEQPEPAKAAVRAAVAEVAAGRVLPFALAAVSVMTTLTGSVLIALAVAHGGMRVEEAWRAAHVDEDFEMAHWGQDAQALERRTRQWEEMSAAASLWRLLQDV